MSEHPVDLKMREGKSPMHLIPWRIVPDAPGILSSCTHPRAIYQACRIVHNVTFDEIAAVFDYGARKYARDNWMSFEWNQAAEDAYYGAICRHLVALDSSEERALDSGLRHAAHACTGCLIWIWHLDRLERAK